MLSLANPPLELLGPPERTAELARLANDGLAEICGRHPRALSGLHRVAADEQHGRHAEEIDRAVRDLGAKGIQVFTNVAGKPFSAPEFRPIFKRMVAHDLPVWVHPMRTAQFSDYVSEKGSEDEIWFTFGWPYETTACMTRLIYSGLFDEMPRSRSSRTTWAA